MFYANSFLSTSPFKREKDAAVIISKNNAVGIEADGTVDSLFNDIQNYSFNNNKILLAAILNNDAFMNYLISIPFIIIHLIKSHFFFLTSAFYLLVQFVHSC